MGDIDVDFRKYRNLAIIMGIICFLASLILAIAAANIIQTEISGKGDLYIRQASEDTVDIAGTKNASFVFSYERNWDKNSNTGSSEFIVIGAKGTPEDQYRVRAKAADTIVEYEASNIIDSFSGSRTFKIILQDTGTDFDNLVLIKGNTTVQGRIRSVDGNGQPRDLEDLFAIGEIAVREYINISSRKDPAEDWLGFCAEVEAKAEEVENQARSQAHSTSATPRGGISSVSNSSP